MTPQTHRWFGIAATVVVAAAVVWGFIVVGSPEARRIQKMDERRISDLQEIAAEMRALVVEGREEPRLKRALFESLQALKDGARTLRLSIVDPETGEPYGYRVLDERRFELCATFESTRNAPIGVSWNHPAGQHCFVIDVLD